MKSWILSATNLHSYTNCGVAVSVCITLKAGPQMAFSKGCFLGFYLNSAMCSISKHHCGRSVPHFSGLKHPRVNYTLAAVAEMMNSAAYIFTYESDQPFQLSQFKRILNQVLICYLSSLLYLLQSLHS